MFERRHKKEVYKRLKQGSGDPRAEQYRAAVLSCKYEVIKVKASLGLNLERCEKDSNKEFSKYINSKRKTGKMEHGSW